MQIVSLFLPLLWLYVAFRRASRKGGREGPEESRRGWVLSPYALGTYLAMHTKYVSIIGVSSK